MLQGNYDTSSNTDAFSLKEEFTGKYMCLSFQYRNTLAWHFSLAVHCSRCMQSFELNGMLLDYFSLCKGNHLSLHKSLEWRVCWTKY